MLQIEFFCHNILRHYIMSQYVGRMSAIRPAGHYNKANDEKVEQSSHDRECYVFVHRDNHSNKVGVNRKDTNSQWSVLYGSQYQEILDQTKTTETKFGKFFRWNKKLTGKYHLIHIDANIRKQLEHIGVRFISPSGLRKTRESDGTPVSTSCTHTALNTFEL